MLDFAEAELVINREKIRLAEVEIQGLKRADSDQFCMTVDRYLREEWCFEPVGRPLPSPPTDCEVLQLPP